MQKVYGSQYNLEKLSLFMLMYTQFIKPNIYHAEIKRLQVDDFTPFIEENTT
jgi:hypothetical protein